MEKTKLYLICPDCHIEQSIRQKYGSNSYFLTALGAVFDVSEFEYIEEVNRLIDNETISEIVIVNDIHCTFICNAIEKNKNHGTKAEEVLENLIANNSYRFTKVGLVEQKKLLARLNIYRQGYDLLNVAFIGNKIADGAVGLSGLIYNRKNSTFEKLKLEL